VLDMKGEKNIFKDIIYPVLILAAVCFVITLLLVLTNRLTKDRITLNAIDLEAAGELLDFDKEKVKVNQLSDIAYELTENDEVKGYIFISESSGYGGPVKVMTGLKADGSVSGVKILENSETPGLGGKIQDESFLRQFINDTFIEQFVVVKNEKQNDNEIQAITGATRSSNAVTDAVNKSINEYKRLIGGGQG